MKARAIFLATMVHALGAGGPADAQSVTNLAAIKGLMPFATLLGAPEGRAVLAANYAVTVAIQTGTSKAPLLLPFPRQQQQALEDAFITRDNAVQLSDGLGTALGKAYAEKATVRQDEHGKTVFSAVAPSLTTLMRYANVTSGLDSEASKYFFANATTNGTTPVSAAALKLLDEARGKTDVLGKAYGKAGGTPGADPYGDSRPFQTAHPFIYYSGRDYLGAEVSSHAYVDQPPHDLAKSPAFPSGHTTYGYTESLLLAMMVPERFQQMVTRGAEYGNDRIVLGAHYAVDVVGGRTLALYDLAQLLANNPSYVGHDLMGASVEDFPAALAQATTDLRATLERGCGATIAICATRDTSRFADRAADRTFVASTQTYGLPTDHAVAAEAFETVAPEAGHLLATRFPYLSLAQRDAVLTTTEGPGGGFLDDGSPFGAFSRIDLFRAADGFGAFTGQTAVAMDAGKGGYGAADTYRNDIDGPGGLTLGGSGHLTLAGHDTYAGPTIVEGGTLEITGSIRSPATVRAGATLVGAGELADVQVIAKGTLQVDGGARIAGTLAMDPGATLATEPRPLMVAGRASVEGAVLRLNAAAPPKGETVLLVAEGGIVGRFRSVASDKPGDALRLRYDATHVYLVAGEAGAKRTGLTPD